MKKLFIILFAMILSVFSVYGENLEFLGDSSMKKDHILAIEFHEEVKKKVLDMGLPKECLTQDFYQKYYNEAKEDGISGRVAHYCLKYSCINGEMSDRTKVTKADCSVNLASDHKVAQFLKSMRQSIEQENIDEIEIKQKVSCVKDILLPGSCGTF